MVVCVCVSYDHNNCVCLLFCLFFFSIVLVA